MFDTSSSTSGKSLANQMNSIHGAQLHPGTLLEDLTARFIGLIQQKLISNSTLNIPRPRNEAKHEVSLYKWCADILVPSATEGVFGRALLDIDREFIKDFHYFDNDSWMLTYRYPRLFARNLYSSMDRNRATLTCYLRLPRSQRSDASYWVSALESKLREVHLEDPDIAILLQLVCWVSVSQSNFFKFALLISLFYFLPPGSPWSIPANKHWPFLGQMPMPTKWLFGYSPTSCILPAPSQQSAPRPLTTYPTATPQ